MSSGRPNKAIEQEAEIAYTNATKAELNKAWDRAFQLYVKAAEGFLHASRTIADERLRASYKANASKALDRAEKIKEIKSGIAPITVDPFDERQQHHVLLKSSNINRRIFPLWSASLDHTRGFNDSDDQPELSDEQRKTSSVWAVPTSLIPNASMFSPGLMPQDIKQHTVTDCSVCASLAICLEHHRQFGSKLALSSLYPQDSSGLPRLAENGQYQVRVFVNGACRRIDIDDKLPFDSSGLLSCMSTGIKHHLWPSIVEKAYMKLMGGYDFPGSNSSIDVHILAGWIPECIEIKSPTFERERTWSRIVKGFSSGLCILTLGTSEQAPVLRDDVWLLPSHNYAVLAVHDSDGERALTILNSWLPPQMRLGQESPYAGTDSSRVFRFLWDEVCGVFHALYLSWDPKMFRTPLDFHGMWKPDYLSEDDRNSSDQHLRIKIQESPSDSSGHHKTDEIWILLTRHITETRRGSEHISLQVQEEEDLLRSSENYVLQKGTFTNTPHVLIRQKISPATKMLSIFPSYDGPFRNVGFSITVYSHPSVSLVWDKRIQKAPFKAKVEGMLTIKNGGGSFTHPTFMLNPQYHLHIRADGDPASGKPIVGGKANVTLWVRGSREVPLNLTVVWSRGQRVFQLAQKDVAATSGPYRYGVSSITRDLPLGDYTVVLSAFEPGQLGDFVLRGECSHRFDLKPIPQEGAGMYNKTVRGAWDARTAMGGPSFKRYLQNPVYLIQVPTVTQVKIRLQLEKYDPAVTINVTLLSTEREGHVATSGPYSDTMSGVAIDQTTLSAGKYLLVPSTYRPGVHAAFRITVYSTTSGTSITRR